MALFLFPHTEKQFIEGFSVPGSEIYAEKWSWMAFYFLVLRDCSKELLHFKCTSVALMMINNFFCHSCLTHWKKIGAFFVGCLTLNTL